MKTLAQAMADRGLKEPKPRSTKYWNSRPSSDRAKNFPSEADVLHRALVEAQGPLFTFSPAVEYGEVPVFSSRALTDWYVQWFHGNNSLKGAA